MKKAVTLSFYRFFVFAFISLVASVNATPQTGDDEFYIIPVHGSSPELDRVPANPDEEPYEDIPLLTTPHQESTSNFCLEGAWNVLCRCFTACCKGDA